VTVAAQNGRQARGITSHFARRPKLVVLATLASIVLAGLATRWIARAGHAPVPSARIGKAVVAAGAVATGNDLGLNVELEQNNARITWNPNSSAVAKAGAGMLVVRDGQSTSETSLNSRELHHGNLLYGPLTNSAMTFELRVGAITEAFSVTLFDRHPSQEVPAPKDSPSAKLFPDQARSTDTPPRVEPRVFIAPRPGAAPVKSQVFPPELPAPPELAATHPGLTQVPLSSNPVAVPAPPPASEAQTGSQPNEQIEYVAPSAVKPVRPSVPANMLRLVSSPVTIRVRVHIDAQGKVVRAESLSRGSTLIDYLSKLATNAAREWQFVPANQGNHPVESETILQFDFDNSGSVEGSFRNK
jgi:hypothetical protein